MPTTQAATINADLLAWLSLNRTAGHDDDVAPVTQSQTAPAS
jgi:hypothetical protein